MVFLAFGVGVTIMNCFFTRMHIGLHVYGEGYITAVRALFPTYMAPVLVIVCFVCGIFGGLLGRAVLKKHFKRAGIA